MLNIYSSNQLKIIKNHNIDVYTNKQIIKKEKKLLKDIFFKYQSFKENNFDLVYQINDFFELMNYNSIEQIEKFLNNFIKKRIFYKIEKDKKIYQNGSFGIINSFSFYNDNLHLILSEEIILSFMDNNIFSFLKVSKFVFMEETFSYKLYLHLIPLFYCQTNVVIELDKLITILNTNDTYERFYDFEKYVLRKAIEDINTFSDYDVVYQKMKAGKNINNKITAIKFILNKGQFHQSFDEVKAANELMNMIKNQSENIKQTYELILFYMIKKDYEYVLNNINYVIKTHDKDIEKHLKKALLYDKASEIKSVKYNLFYEDHLFFRTTFILQKNLWTQLRKLADKYNNSLELNRLYHSDFFKKIIRLKDREVLEFEDEIVKIFVQYNKDAESIIKIYTTASEK